YLPGRDGKHEVRVFSRGIGCEFPSGIAWTPQGSLMALGSSQLFLISIGLQHDTLTAWQRRLGDPVARVRVALRSPDLQSHEQRGLEFIHALWIGSDSASQENSKSLIERLVPKAAQSVERRPDTQSEDGYWSALADIAAIVNDLTSLALDDKEYRWHLDALSGYLQLLPLEVLSTVILNSHSFEGNRQDELARWLSEFGVSISVPAYLIWLAANDGARHRIQDLFPTDRGDSAIQTLDRSFVTRLIWLIAVSKADHATYMFEDNWWKDRATSKFMSLLSSEDVERFWNHISERGLFEAGFDNKANETNDRVFWFV
ncbi:MAG: hypothetical protein JNL58_32155, partial [Planctomyces sp.]|nr:hypothetical protein [Planctomyces sp.]